MKRVADEIAASMSERLNSDEYKSMFDYSEKLKKLAFKKVSDGDQPTEIEQEIIQELEAKAEDTCNGCKAKVAEGACVCSCKSAEDCAKGCSCKCTKVATASLNENELVKIACDMLMKASGQLDDIGYERLAIKSAKLAKKLLEKAKAGKKDKAKTKDKNKDKSKSKDKKEDKKENGKDKSKEKPKDKNDKFNFMKNKKDKKEDKKDTKKAK